MSILSDVVVPFLISVEVLTPNGNFCVEPLLRSVSGITNCNTFIYKSNTASPPIPANAATLNAKHVHECADRPVCTPWDKHLMVWAVSCMPQMLYSQGRATLPTDWEAGLAPGPFTKICPCRESNHDSSVIQPAY
jgi:hypothetical protein